MTEDEKRIKRIIAIGEIHNAGFHITDRHDFVEPKLMGGYEYIARRGSYVLAYNIIDRNICVQKTDKDYINHDNSFVIKWLSFDDFTEKSLILTLGMKIGLDYYNGL